MKTPKVRPHSNYHPRYRLTEIEAKAVNYSVFQPHLLKSDSTLRAALRRAAKKCEEQRRVHRQRAIYMAGFFAGRLKVSRNTHPTFRGDKLGSLESLNWWRGYDAGRPKGGR